MATVTIEGEPGETVTVIFGAVTEWEDEPDPGEEKPEEVEVKVLKAVGK